MCHFTHTIPILAPSSPIALPVHPLQASLQPPASHPLSPGTEIWLLTAGRQGQAMLNGLLLLWQPERALSCWETGQVAFGVDSGPGAGNTGSRQLQPPSTLWEGGEESRL